MTELSIQKRRSGTISGAERITGVKNAQAEMILSRRLNQYQNHLKRNQLNIQTEEFKLQQESRLLSLDSKKNDLDYKKRLYPGADLSHEEMTIQKLKKYLVTNAEHLCYLDKSLGYKVRGRGSSERLPLVVEQARLTLRRNELLKELEEARMKMYSFFNPNHRQKDNDSIYLTGLDDEEEELDKATRHNQGVFPEIPEITARPITNRRKKTMKEKLKENPVVREAYEAHRRRQEEEANEKPSISPTQILARIAKMKPLTLNDLQAETDQVQGQVNDFNQRIEDVIWSHKQEQFQQNLKFVQDKDAAWNNFMEKMNKRNRGEQERPKTTPATIGAESPRLTHTSHARRRPLTQHQKRNLLMKNLLITAVKKEEVEVVKTNQRGIPHHAAARMKRNSISAKMRKLTSPNGDSMGGMLGAAVEQARAEAV